MNEKEKGNIIVQMIIKSWRPGLSLDYDSVHILNLHLILMTARTFSIVFYRCSFAKTYRLTISMRENDRRSIEFYVVCSIFFIIFYFFKRSTSEYRIAEVEFITFRTTVILLIFNSPDQRGRYAVRVYPLRCRRENRGVERGRERERVRERVNKNYAFENCIRISDPG